MLVAGISSTGTVEATVLVVVGSTTVVEVEAGTEVLVVEVVDVVAGTTVVVVVVLVDGVGHVSPATTTSNESGSAE